VVAWTKENTARQRSWDDFAAELRLAMDSMRTLFSEELGIVGGQTFNLAVPSRDGKASVIDEKKYQQFRRREAKKLGLDLLDEA